jgi:hypothetical protein
MRPIARRSDVPTPLTKISTFFGLGPCAYFSLILACHWGNKVAKSGKKTALMWVSSVYTRSIPSTDSQIRQFTRSDGQERIIIILRRKGKSNGVFPFWSALVWYDSGGCHRIVRISGNWRDLFLWFYHHHPLPTNPTHAWNIDQMPKVVDGINNGIPISTRIESQETVSSVHCCSTQTSPATCYRPLMND